MKNLLKDFYESKLNFDTKEKFTKKKPKFKNNDEKASNKRSKRF